MGIYCRFSTAVKAFALAFAFGVVAGFSMASDAGRPHWPDTTPGHSAAVPGPR